MGEHRRIAVLVTSYNAEAFILQSLDSITAQTRPPNQVFVADDGSTDGTRGIIEAWAQRQSFEVVIRPAGQGASGSPAGGRQWGLENSTADLVALLDHDDLFLPHALARMEAAYGERPDLVLCFADARAFQADPSIGWSMLDGIRVSDVVMEQASGLRVLGSGFFHRLLRGSCVPTSSNLWRRDIALAAGGFSEVAGSSDDALMWLRLCRRGTVGYYPEIVSCRRLHGTNLSRDNLAAGISAYRARMLTVREADALRLSEAERDDALDVARSLLPMIAYHASHAGVRTYLRVTRSLEVRIRPGRLLVSLVASVGGLDGDGARH